MKAGFYDFILIFSISLLGCSSTGGEPKYGNISIAAEKGDLKDVKKHLERGASVNDTPGRKYAPLCYAAANGHVDVVEFLISKGADVNYSGGSSTPLHDAAWGGHLEVVRILISNGADVNSKTKHLLDTPLHFAARQGRTAVAELLLENGANVNAVDVNGAKPLGKALTFKHWDTADLLKRYGGTVK